MRLITKLLRALDRGGVCDGEKRKLHASKFAGLLDLPTLRIVTSFDFCEAGKEMHGDIEKTKREWWIARCAPHKPYTGDPMFAKVMERSVAGKWWLEIEFPNGVSLAFWRPDAEYTYPGAFAELVDADYEGYGPVYNTKYTLVVYEHDGRIVCEGVEDVQKRRDGRPNAVPMPYLGNDRTLYQQAVRWLGGFLYASMSMPPRLVSEQVAELGVPKILRDQVPKNPLFNTVYFNSKHQIAKGERTTLDISGRRWHFVRAHNMTPHNKTEPTWRKAHWRGDPSLGVVRKIYVAKAATI